MLRAMAEHDARTSTMPIHYQVIPPRLARLASMPSRGICCEPGIKV